MPDSALHQVTITLPDGATRAYAAGTTVAEVAASISKSLAKKAVAGEINGVVHDLSTPLADDSQVAIITRDSDVALELVRHDAAHVMAEAVQELYPGTQVTIGPAIEHGFYYDFARDEPFTPEDLEKIEAKMREIIKRDEPFLREEWDRQDAIRHFEALGETFKAELIRDLPESETISISAAGRICRLPAMWGPRLSCNGLLAHTGAAILTVSSFNAFTVLRGVTTRN